MIRSLMVLVMLSGAAIAKPPALVKVKTSTYTLSLPKAWTVTPSENGLVLAQLDPKRKDAPAILVMYAPNANGTTEDQLLQAVTSSIATDVKVLQKKTLPGAGQIIISEGTAETIEVRIVAIVAVTPQVALLALFVGKPADFDGLGAVELLTSVVGSIAPAAPSPAVQTATKPSEIPAPSHMPAPGDLAGEWDHDDSAFSNYVSSSTGQYAGYSAISTKEHWIVDRKGGVQTVFHAYANGRVVDEKHSGTISIAADGTLEVKLDGKGATTKYLIRGFTAGSDASFLKLNGPWYDAGIPDDVRRDPAKGTNLDGIWVRKAAKTK